MTMEKANKIAQERIAELEGLLKAEQDSNHRLSAKELELEADVERLRETLHQIYSEACFILNSEDDVDAWGFVKSTRDIALQKTPE